MFIDVTVPCVIAQHLLSLAGIARAATCTVTYMKVHFREECDMSTGSVKQASAFVKFDRHCCEQLHKATALFNSNMYAIDAQHRGGGRGGDVGVRLYLLNLAGITASSCIEVFLCPVLIMPCCVLPHQRAHLQQVT